MLFRISRKIRALALFLLILVGAALVGLANAGAAGFACPPSTTGYYSPPTATPALPQSYNVPTPPEGAVSAFPPAAAAPTPPATAYYYGPIQPNTVAPYAAAPYAVAPYPVPQIRLSPWYQFPGAVVAARPAYAATPGVVVRPKVYVRGQPIRNFWRAVTP